MTFVVIERLKSARSIFRHADRQQATTAPIVSRVFLAQIASLRADIERIVASAESDPSYDILSAAVSLPIAQRIGAGFAQALGDKLRPTAIRIGAAIAIDARKDLPAPSPQLVDQIADEWIRTQGAVLVRSVTDSTREGIRDAIRALVTENATIPEMARTLRDVVGLTPCDVGAVLNAVSRWRTEGIDPDVITRRRERYSQQLLNQRAETIARTETSAALNYSQHAEWLIAESEGDLPSTMQREWMARDGCKLCAPMDGQRVGLNEPFQSSVGPIFSPPLHPNCVCGVGLVGG